MKRLTIITLTLTLMVFAFASAATAKTITLRFANQDPETSWNAEHAVRPYIKQIEEATKGRVKIDMYYNQTLAKGPDMWNAVQLGITDIGWCFHGYWAEMTPLADVISLPGVPFRTARKGSEVLWRLYEKYPEIQKEFDANKVLLTFTSHPYILITRNKPVKKLEDIRGMKIRMTGGPPTDQVRRLGGTPVLIPMPDCYMSLAQGIVDGMGAPWEVVYSLRLYETVNYYTEVPFPAVYFSIAMNKNKWNSLDKDIQDAIMSVSGIEGSKFWGYNYFDTVKDAAIKRAQADGKTVDIIQLEDSERERWLEISGKPIWEDWVNKMKAKGYQNAAEILNTAIELSK